MLEPSLYDHLHHHASERKLRLLLCAIVRQVWPDQPPFVKAAVEQCEMTADQPHPTNILRRLQRGARELVARPKSNELPDAPPSVLELLRLLTIDNLTFQTVERFGRIFTALPVANRISKEPVWDIFRNHDAAVVADPAWRTANVIALAQVIYDERAFDRLPILADAMEDAGCANADLLQHCRQPGEHVRGCWVVDLLLGKS